MEDVASLSEMWNDCTDESDEDSYSDSEIGGRGGLQTIRHLFSQASPEVVAAQLLDKVNFSGLRHDADLGEFILGTGDNTSLQGDRGTAGVSAGEL